MCWVLVVKCCFDYIKEAKLSHGIWGEARLFLDLCVIYWRTEVRLLLAQHETHKEFTLSFVKKSVYDRRSQNCPLKHKVYNEIKVLFQSYLNR